MFEPFALWLSRAGQLYWCGRALRGRVPHGHRCPGREGRRESVRSHASDNVQYPDSGSVTNEEFRWFVREKKFKTESERFGWSFVFHSFVPEDVKAKMKEAVTGDYEIFNSHSREWKYVGHLFDTETLECDLVECKVGLLRAISVPNTGTDSGTRRGKEAGNVRMLVGEGVSC